MGTIQIVLSDATKAETLRSQLSRSATAQVFCAQQPEFEKACVVVLDEATFQQFGAHSSHPDRIVLITRNDPSHLREAWDAGVSSVVSAEDPINTVVLSILAACLRTGSSKVKPVGGAEK